ncbi:MAG: 16S rRNA (guanine(966)-N(2))-methyltransferase RsmD, partial [Chromatiaceae bacterium]
MTQRSLSLPGRLRIVGGEWRGRRLPVLDQPGLRPTPDRVRETLFNWLAPLIRGAWCLDLFAGSGALGFEAASRGADRVVMIEKLANVARVLHENKLLLDARQIEVIHTDAGPWLAGQAEPFNLVFLDPPFAEDLLGPSC